MKCPQCGYTSFDYAESCEKCGNDLTSMRTLLNIPSVKPNAPSFLSALIDGTYTPKQAPESEETTGESIELSEEEVNLGGEEEVGLAEKSKGLDSETEMEFIGQESEDEKVGLAEEEEVGLAEKSKGLDSETEEEVDSTEELQGLDSETEMEFIGQESEDDK